MRVNLDSDTGGGGGVVHGANPSDGGSLDISPQDCSDMAAPWGFPFAFASDCDYYVYGDGGGFSFGSPREYLGAINAHA